MSCDTSASVPSPLTVARTDASQIHMNSSATHCDDRATSIVTLVSGLSVSSPQNPQSELRSLDRVGDTADRVGNSPKTSPSTGSAPLSPDPKIPRPKNAFILYRIHHYEAITAQHPGISNPEISKMVGQMWRSEPKEEKDKWMALATEDKLRHQKQFPGYKFRPKRGAKSSNMSDTPASGGAQPSSSCHTCSKTSDHPHGDMANPRSTEMIQSSEPGLSRALPTPRTMNTMGTPTTAFLPVQNFPTQSPMEARYPEAYYTKRDVNHMDVDGTHESALGSKRRRLEFLHPASQSQQLEHTATHERAHASAASSNHRLPQPEYRFDARRESLPSARDVIAQVSPRTIAPSPGLTVAPGPGYGQHRMLLKRSPAGKDLSLTLPPLQAPVAHQGTGQSGSAGCSTATTVTSSAPQTAFRQSFPSALVPLVMLLHKQAVLKKVLQVPPTLCKRPQRAVVIAIDGDDPAAIDYLSNCLAETLRLTSGTNSAFIDAPRLPLTKRTGEERRFECLDTVKQWCTISLEMSDFMMRNPMEIEASESGDTIEAGSISNRIAEQPPSVLFIRSWLMSTIDRYTAWIPVTNGHRVTEHWEWTAYMWQGLLAPDLVIYVRTASSEEISDRGVTEIAEGGELMLIRHCKEDAVPDPDGQHGHGFQSGALRRLGFEVGEWLEERRTRSEP